MQSWRSSHRSRSHDSAHAEDESTHHNHSIEHALVPHGPAQPIIDRQQSLDSTIDELRAAGSFAYDTEFIGELTYHPLLCLIQVATIEKIFLIDPMASIDLRRFWELLADESVKKIVHAGQQDVEPIPRHLQDKSIGARNVVDTQIAAGFCGKAYPVSLSKLVMETLGVKLGKGLTFTHWDQRPLSNVQLRYAADDVRFLPAVWDALARTLDELDHMKWARAECEEMCDPAQFGFKPDEYFARVRGAGTLSGNGVAVLRELTIWRDAAARTANVPARALVKDEILIDMSRSPIKSLDRLARVRGLPKPVENQHGQAMIDATLRALNSMDAKHPLPRLDEPTPTERFNADSLYAVAGAICSGRSIDPGLATSRQEIVEFFHHHRTGDDVKLEGLHVMRGWRREALGGQLRNFLDGNGDDFQLKVTWNDGKLYTTAVKRP